MHLQKRYPFLDGIDRNCRNEFSRLRGKDLRLSKHLRMLHMLPVACDKGVHLSDELKSRLQDHGILVCLATRFLAPLPPNMTEWLQPLDLVVCGLVQRHS